MKNWYKTSQVEIRFTDECYGYHHGQSDCVLRAFFVKDPLSKDIVDDQSIGRIEYSVLQEELRI